jgi:serine protein kinase
MRTAGGGLFMSGRQIISLVASRQDLDQFRRKNWVGSFEEYLDLVRDDPRIARNAFERVIWLAFV